VDISRGRGRFDAFSRPATRFWREGPRSGFAIVDESADRRMFEPNLSLRIDRAGVGP